jgi:hypothetical protein
VALQSNVFSRVLPLQSVKSGNVDGGSNPSVLSGLSASRGTVTTIACRLEYFLPSIEFEFEFRLLGLSLRSLSKCEAWKVKTGEDKKK